MKTWRDVLVLPSASIVDALRIIDENALQITLVVDTNTKLLGTVTDGDIRRAILKGFSLNTSVSEIMNTKPVTVGLNSQRDEIINLLVAKKIQQVPVVDNAGHVVGLESLKELLHPSARKNWVVLMVGGMGSRLRPLTEECPKPLLKVGNKPILEIILENFIRYGYTKFFFAVNYKAEMIEEYFGDGSRFGIEIHYLRERERLGTAGALGLLPERPTDPFLVMNGDLLTKVNFNQLFEFHQSHQVQATMCVREYSFQVPYGVVNVNKGSIKNIVEKPVHNFFISGGIYILDPCALDLIPDSYFDMPTLFNCMIESGMKTTAFPIHEYWLDIGKFSDFEKANIDFREIFG